MHVYTRVHTCRVLNAKHPRDVASGETTAVISKLQPARRGMIRKLMHCYATPIANCTKARPYFLIIADDACASERYAAREAFI